MTIRKNNVGKIKYGRISQVKKKNFAWGKVGAIWKRFDSLATNGYLIDFTKSTEYENWADPNSENLCLVENGSAVIEWNDKRYNIKNKKFVFKVYPGQSPVIKPKGTFKVLSIQLKSSVAKTKQNGIDLSEIEVVDTDKIPTKVYEFETLAQELFTPKYKGGIGLIKFAFVNPIPIHLHPQSARLIRPIRGKGFTYMEPNAYEAHKDTYALIPTGVVHTNGNIPGNVLHLYAVQLPWVESHIDEENIAGAPKFVKYIGITPPKKLWKTKPQFEKLIKVLEKK
jgi:hypothetical protein